MQYLHGMEFSLSTLSDRLIVFKACSPIRLYPGCYYSGRHRWVCVWYLLINDMHTCTYTRLESSKISTFWRTELTEHRGIDLMIYAPPPPCTCTTQNPIHHCRVLVVFEVSELLVSRVICVIPQLRSTWRLFSDNVVDNSRVSSPSEIYNPLS